MGKSISWFRWRGSSHPLSHHHADPGPQDLLSIQRPSETMPRSNFSLRRVCTKGPAFIGGTLTLVMDRRPPHDNPFTYQNSTPDTFATSVLDSQDRHPFSTNALPPSNSSGSFPRATSVVWNSSGTSNIVPSILEDCTQQLQRGYKVCGSVLGYGFLTDAYPVCRMPDLCSPTRNTVRKAHCTAPNCPRITIYQNLRPQHVPRACPNSRFDLPSLASDLPSRLAKPAWEFMSYPLPPTAVNDYTPDDHS